MNKLRKIGITALAGSLASVSAAQAGSMAVSGSAELTWIGQDADEVTGNPIGQKKNLSFSGSGELDNGWTFGVMHAMNDAMSGLSSSNVTLTMGSLGTIAFDAGTGGYGGTAVDNVVPTAWEEADDGFSTGMSDIGAVSGSKNILNYTTPAHGTTGSKLSLTWAPRTGAAHVADGGSGKTDGGRGYDIAVVLINAGGVTIGGAVSEIEVENKTARTGGSHAGSHEDEWEATAYVKAAFGPISLGIQQSAESTGTNKSTGIAHKKSAAGGIAINLMDNFSIGYQKLKSYVDMNTDYEKIAATFEGYTAAYNMGPLAIKYKDNEVTNLNNTDGNDSQKEVSISMAF